MKIAHHFNKEAWRKGNSKFIIFLLLSFFLNYGSTLNAQEEKPDTVKIGAYVSSIFDFNFKENSLNAEIYFWAHYKNPEFNFTDILEVLQSSNYSIDGIDLHEMEDYYWFDCRTQFKSHQSFSAKKYPFDHQKLVFNVENHSYSKNSLVFVADTEHSGVDPIVSKQLGSWKIKDINFSTSEHVYKTSFGNPAEAESEWSLFDITIELQRKDSWLLLFKLITAIVIAFAFTLSSFFLDASKIAIRLSLTSGGLIVAVGSKYVVENIIQSTNELSLLDFAHNFTFIGILLIIIMTIISNRVYEKNKDNSIKLSKKIDLISFFSILTIYVGAFIPLIIWASR